MPLIDAASDRPVCRLGMKLYSVPGSMACPTARQPRHVARVPQAEDDPYLLVLLAEQEFDEGREDQAKYLIDVAYEGFDQYGAFQAGTLGRTIHPDPG